MNLDDEQIGKTLGEALTCYLSILGRVKNFREARLPIQGKAVETSSDILLEQDYEQRVAATELCLRFTPDIATNVCYWASESDSVDELQDDNDEESMADVGNTQILTVLDHLIPKDEEGTEQVFVDIFSGKWIEPHPEFTPGPSNAGNLMEAQEPKQLRMLSQAVIRGSNTNKT
ncbi:hypothetical protein M7I_1117 [Glarea lozoyensis 74030]|uniref:Uncharacterized protein n=1 Tax=Glarea lozoyensis (strain ATCC 74030 / MF5533) TaxID=1104152 RepID=H0EF78_GLAL7|nr:hypothetical protein M7I_1117 [Glarea lozoyensis 74030]